MKRKMLIATLTVMMSLFSVLQVAAMNNVTAPPDEIQPMYQNLQQATANLNISGKGTASIYVEAYGKSGTSRISVSYSLQKLNNNRWTNVGSWSKSANGSYLYASADKAVAKGTYRVCARITVYKGVKSETITKYSTTRRY